MGFPVSHQQAMAMGTPVIPLRDPARAAAAAGNAMHFSCICVVELIALTCFAKVAGDQQML